MLCSEKSFCTPKVAPDSPQKLLMLICLLLQLTQDVTGVVHGATLDHLATPRFPVAHDALPFPKRQCVLVSHLVPDLGLPMVRTDTSHGVQMLCQRCMGVTREGCSRTSSKNAMNRSPSRNSALAATRALCCPKLKSLEGVE